MQQTVPEAPTVATEKYVASVVPDHCSGDGGECLPPSPWVYKLCNGVQPEVALQMFRGGSPWQRMYSRTVAPAYNGAGGSTVAEENVAKNEELIALQRHGAKDNEIVIDNTSSYDLLRWNGSCVTLHDGEYSSKAPRRTVHSRVEWRLLGDDVQSALRDDDLIQDAYLARRKDCRGSMGYVTKACEKSESSLMDAIVDYVRDGGRVPTDAL